MSWDAVYYALNWQNRNRMSPDFWEQCLDLDGNLRPECSGWIREIGGLKDNLDNWKAAQEANELYEYIRGRLSEAGRTAADTLFSELFGLSFCAYWKDYNEQVHPEREWLEEVDCTGCISPERVVELLALWTPELAEELELAYPPEEEGRCFVAYFRTAEDLMWYFRAWMELIRSVRSLGNWGLLWMVG